jgi:hypothetical protein
MENFRRGLLSSLRAGLTTGSGASGTEHEHQQYLLIKRKFLGHYLKVM